MTLGLSAPPADVHTGQEARLYARRRALLWLSRSALSLAFAPLLGLTAQTGTVVNVAKLPFGAGSLAEVLRLLNAEPTPSDKIELSLPDLVENGAMVPVQITSRLPGAQDIFIISEANPFPLVARFSVPDESTEAFIATRIKVASSCNVYALIELNGRFYSAARALTVTIGGCGA